VNELVVRPQAEADIDAAAGFYAGEEDVELGLRFYDAVERTLEALVQQPNLGSVQAWVADRLRGCRRWPVARPFGVHQIFYLAHASGIEVVRLLHGSRDLPRLLG
jgi:plasmid stabilization system protein ParE